MALPSTLLRQALGDQPWLDARLAEVAAGDATALMQAIGQAARRVGRASVGLDATACPGWDLSAWSRDQAARALLLAAWPGGMDVVDRVFHAGTVEELTALYQGLPLYRDPPAWAARAAEGVRSNMRPIFDAVALGNPYPAASLPDGAFHQMVLKAFFVGADVSRILGLARRHHPDLGRMLADYARERRAARRSVDPRLPPLARACGADCPDQP
jgi:hypothetical protein